jgi:hypothetical protein
VSGQIVWFFDKPTIRYCQRHDTTDFTYTDWSGLVCAKRGKGECDEAVWVDFECSSLAFHDTAEKAQEEQKAVPVYGRGDVPWRFVFTINHNAELVPPAEGERLYRVLVTAHKPHEHSAWLLLPNHVLPQLAAAVRGKWKGERTFELTVCLGGKPRRTQGGKTVTFYDWKFTRTKRPEGT